MESNALDNVNGEISNIVKHHANGVDAWYWVMLLKECRNVSKIAMRPRIEQGIQKPGKRHSPGIGGGRGAGCIHIDHGLRGDKQWDTPFGGTQKKIMVRTVVGEIAIIE